MRKHPDDSFPVRADPGRYIWYNARTNHSIFDEVLEQDEHEDLDHHADCTSRPTFYPGVAALKLED